MNKYKGNRDTAPLNLNLELEREREMSGQLQAPAVYTSGKQRRTH